MIKIICCGFLKGIGMVAGVMVFILFLLFLIVSDNVCGKGVLMVGCMGLFFCEV